MAGNVPEETPAPKRSGGFSVPRVPGMAWCLTEDEPARRACGAGNHRVVMLPTLDPDGKEET